LILLFCPLFISF